MALVRIYQKPAGTPANSSVFAVEIQQNNIWYTKKVSWEDLKGLIAGATSLVFNNGTVTFTTPDGVAHEVLSVDDEVFAASGNPVTGGAVSTALAGKQDTLTFDQVPTDGSTNPVESNGIYDALALKQDTLTFDSTPTDGSTNPVTSQGIYAAISAVTSGIDWKEAVATYADIATTYPNPEDGWTVTTLDDDHTYRYNGTAWVDLFSLITLATSTKDGLMSSADFTKLSGIEAGATRTIVDDALSTSSTNPVQNKVITGKLNTFLDVNETITTNPYTKKLVPSGAYTEKLRKIVGATVNWNQLVALAEKTWTVGTADSTRKDLTDTVKGGHVYYICAYQEQAMASNTRNTFYHKVGGNYTYQEATTNRELPAGVKFWVYKPENDGVFGFWTNAPSIETTYDNAMCFDLTAMFSNDTSIAERVYTLEQETAGSGIAWLKRYGFLLDAYNAYTLRGLQSVSLAAKKNVGANLWGGDLLADDICAAISTATKDTSAKNVTFTATGASGKTIYTDFLPNTQYTIIFVGNNITNNRNTNLQIRYTDGTNLPIQFPQDSSAVQTAVKVSTAGKTIKEIRGANYAGSCILQYEKCGLFIGEKTADDFEPYEEITTELDSTPLRGLFGLDANNNIVANGDEYTPDGAEAVKYGEVSNLGDLNWEYDSANTRFRALVTNVKFSSAPRIIPFIIEKYRPISDGRAISQITSGDAYIGDGNFKGIFIHDSDYTDPAVFKTAVAGLKMVYPLYIPTTATLTPYEKLQPIEQGGTEEFVDYGVQSGTRDVAIPAGNETAYGDNENMGKIINYMTT